MMTVLFNFLIAKSAKIFFELIENIFKVQKNNSASAVSTANSSKIEKP